MWRQRCAFFDIHFVHEDSFVWVMSTDVVDQVEYAEQGEAKLDRRDLFFDATLVDGELR